MINLDTLLAIGLTKSESELYVVSLELGAASAIQLGQKAGLSRQMIYVLLPSLLEKGLMKQVSIGKRHYYQAVNPDVLTDKAKEVVKEIEQLVPVLKSHASPTKALPLVSIYDNPISMREWYRQFMKEAKRGEQMYIWSCVVDWYGLDSEFYQKYMQFQAKKGIKTFVIAPDTPEVRKVTAQIGNPEKEYRYLQEAWHSATETLIWRDQILHLTISGNATNLIVIESAALAELEKTKFMQAWDHNAKR